jgi:hypothetical protein
MTINLQSAGTWAAGTTSVTPTNPAHASGDILVLTVFAKPTLTATPPLFGTPSGWNPLTNGSGHDGSGTAQGTDAGQVWVASFTKVATGSAEANPVCSVTNGNVCMAVVNTWRKTIAGAWTAQAVIAGDTTSATSWSTVHAAMNLAPTDGLNYAAAASGNGTNSNIFPASIGGFTATGHTFFAGTTSGPANTNSGTDMAAVVYNLLVATGVSTSVSATASATLLSAQKGCSILIRLREPMDRTGTASISESSSVTASGSKATGGAGSVSSTPTVNTTGAKGADGAASISQTSTVTATGERRVDLGGPASIDQASTVTVVGAAGLQQTASISQTSSTSASGVAARGGGASISHAPTTSTVGVKGAEGAAVVTSTPTVAAAGVHAGTGTAVVSSPSTVTVTGSRAAFGAAAAISQTSSVTVVGVEGAQHQASISQPSTVTAAGVAARSGTASVSQPSTVTTSGSAGRFGDAAVNLAAATVTATGEQGSGPPPAPSGGGQVVVLGQRTTLVVQPLTHRL